MNWILSSLFALLVLLIIGTFVAAYISLRGNHNRIKSSISIKRSRNIPAFFRRIQINAAKAWEGDKGQYEELRERVAELKIKDDN